MSDFGTLDWVYRNKGYLSWNEKMKMTFQAVITKTAFSLRVSRGIKFRNLNLNDIIPPDSNIAKEAALICETGSPWIFFHSMRAYFWARMMADPDLKFDNEATFVSFMLHDLGLCEKYRLGPKKDGCFSQVGAEKSLELATAHGWNDQRSHLIANAIALHLNITVDEKFGPEAELLRSGTAADVVGLGLDKVAPELIGAVIDKYPRSNFKKNLISAIEYESQQRPCCRIGFMQRYLGLQGLINKSPFHE